MNDVYKFLNFTMEVADDFADAKLPTLDFKLWVVDKNVVVYSFFEKPMSSNQVIHRDSALPENMKISSLTAEVLRRMMNVSELLPDSERVAVLDRFAQKMANSGYGLLTIRRVIVAGLKGYEARVLRSKLDKSDKKWRSLHESSEASWGSRWRKKLLGKMTWFRGKQPPQSEESADTAKCQTECETKELNVKERQRQKSKVNRGKRRAEKQANMTVEQKRKLLETTTVMFLENTPYGELTRRLQECEDRLGEVVGRRVKMVEQGGTQLRHLLPNTNPWAGGMCGRNDCTTCNQSGDRKRNDDCFRRNVLYEAACGVCLDESHGGDGAGKRVRLKFGESYPEENIYVGETSRSIFERSQEHVKAGMGKKEESFIAKHWLESHPEREVMPEFRFKVVKSFKDPLSRQVSESVRIDLRRGVLNSKTMFSRNTLPRLTFEQSEWEKKREEKEQDQQKRELREKREAWLKGKTDSPLGREEIEVWGENRDKINLEEEAIDSETWELETKRLVKGKKRDFVENTREDKLG